MSTLHGSGAYAQLLKTLCIEVKLSYKVVVFLAIEGIVESFPSRPRD
ncbi:MAG: hypothetical protein BROFUL_00146 [Candidatus Brocadia fulgida]|uniref:Uncharacterized protein n=1 Tax=Candidatus Brocadia fulgida TaxID=380242 RepID=A0A0M2V1V1_9BACT|nr:MAG: hypothetical protein BROFUL_00146 [Candidatus Brocadia fulgida]